MRVWFSLLGAEVFSFGVRFTEKPLIVVQQPDGGLEPGEISGGQSGSFERDTAPLSPDDRYTWDWDDRAGFGFKM